MVESFDASDLERRSNSDGRNFQGNPMTTHT